MLSKNVRVILFVLCMFVGNIHAMQDPNGAIILIGRMDANNTNITGHVENEKIEQMPVNANATMTSYQLYIKNLIPESGSNITIINQGWDTKKLAVATGIDASTFCLGYFVATLTRQGT